MSRSCYILELSVSPGRARRADLFAYGELAHIRRCLEHEFFDEDPKDRAHAASMAAEGETIALWVVEGGRVVHGLDLRPLIRVRVADDAPVSLADARSRDEAWKARLASAVHVDVQIDWDAIAHETLPLRGPRLRPGEVLELQASEDVLLAVDSYLEVIEEVTYGYEDLDGGAPAPPGFRDPDPPPA